jgi:hypothetical protein
MEVPWRNSLYNYLKQAKCHFFLPVFFLYNIGEQQGGTGPAWGGWYQWEAGGGREMVKNGEYGANTAYTCM